MEALMNVLYLLGIILIIWLSSAIALIGGYLGKKYPRVAIFSEIVGLLILFIS